MSEVLVLSAKTVRSLSAEVDRLADLNAEIAHLTEEAANIKADLAASGETEVVGVYHKARISYIGPSEKVDWKAVAEKLNPSRQLIAAHTKISGGGVRISLYDL